MIDHDAHPLVIAEDLHKTFTIGEQVVQALNGVSLEVPEGQFIAIMGPSGSGKSTLLYALGGLDRPSSGAIEIAGYRLDSMSSEGAWRISGAIRAGSSFRRSTSYRRSQRFKARRCPACSAASRRKCGKTAPPVCWTRWAWANDLDHRPNPLSGGQQQRGGDARALFNDPR
ncbi:MAG: ATP-binding cassette domain-containing protein [Chloroflexi bacterium]|nr:ATP-binding cassette domain-containing protein [Chloroflexota bacterium]